MGMNLTELAARQASKAVGAAGRNRADAIAHGMGCAVEWLDLLRANGFPNASVTHVTDGEGWAIGKREPGSFPEVRMDGQWGDKA